jgi:Mg2+/Co2+ transporter CorB
MAMISHPVLLTAGIIFFMAISAFFSASETSMMSINRYRLKYLAKKYRVAKRVQKLLEKPDRLIGVILLGGTFAHIAASSISTLIALSMFGEIGILFSSIFMTIILLIFSELAPKTLAVLYPEPVAFSCSLILKGFLWILYPLVWIINGLANSILRIFNISLEHAENQSMTQEELRTIVHETTGRHIPSKHRLMLLSILDLEKLTVEDIMVPRNAIVGLDLEDEWEDIIEQLSSTQHTFLPVYKQDINHLIGTLHAKSALHLMVDEDVDEAKLRKSLDEAHFVPEGTPLTTQLINFQKNKRRFAFVVDEYGDILGLITLEDILEEIVGDFTTDVAATYASILIQEDGAYLVDGSVSLRELNRVLPWRFSTAGPKTINGLVIDYLQRIPEAGTCCKIDGIVIEVLQVQDNKIKNVKIIGTKIEDTFL